MPPIDPSARPTYSPEQVRRYFDRIKLPQRYCSHVSSSGHVDPSVQLELLARLIKYQITAVPFENLDLHYSSHHSVNIDPMHTFQKVVEAGNGRGGYCMENTSLLATVLRSLGYQVMSTGARVNEAIQPIAAGKNWAGPRFDGWNHMVNIVTIARQKYLVDVGFGSNGPSFPVPLVDGVSALNVRGSLDDDGSGHTVILQRKHIPDNTHRVYAEQLLWVYSVRFNDGMDWLPAYCFSELEYLPRDFETMNFFVSNSPSSWFTFHVVAVRFLMDDDENIIGDVTLFGDEIKERKYGTSRALCTISSEAERIDALERYLGIRLSPAERAGIGRMISQIL